MHPATATLDDRIARHRRDVLAFLARRAPDEAEELAQETWLRVAAAAPEVASEEAFRAYAFTVARRLLIDHYRKRSRRLVLVPLDGGAEVATHTDPYAEVSAGQTLAVVEAELNTMNADLAEVFRLRTSTDLSFRDIALRQGVPVNTALGRMHQAVKKLAAALGSRGMLRGGP